jgi:hypothetical protein
MRLISDRISIDETNNFSVVILGKVERWKESLLLFWVLAWTFCGLVFLTYFFGDTPYHYDLSMLILLSFWAYFEVRIVKVFFWRRKGYEQLQFKDNAIVIRNSLFTKGKERVYELDAIDAFYAMPDSSRNFFAFMDDSFWVIGGDRIYFDYFGKKVVFAKQISTEETRKTLQVLNGKLKLSKKDLRKRMKKMEEER